MGDVPVKTSARMKRTSTGPAQRVHPGEETELYKFVALLISSEEIHFALKSNIHAGAPGIPTGGGRGAGKPPPAAS